MLTPKLANAVGMTMALELHREMDVNARVTPVEREVRRRMFWSCYLLDRFMACGSKRPSLIGDRTILLRLPCWAPNPASLPVEGDLFQSGSNLQSLQDSVKKSQGSSGMLIDISRILGITNRYLAAGGVKGDSHFPWHSLSNLSKIRQDLDIWASGTDDVLSSLDALFGQPDSTVLVLSKLVYHLIHCLIYRPFLPIDLSELAGPGQHQSWQIDATNMCFLHANAIAELVELGKQTTSVEWPAFVGYCICTAGTVHIHGAHYSRNAPAGDINVFASSADFLSREMQQLSELRYAWASVQHQRETLQGIYNAHAELAKSLANRPMRYSPVFHLEDFFDRYADIGGPGGPSFSFDAANLSLADVVVDFMADAYTGHDLYAPRRLNGATAAEPMPFLDRPNRKRKSMAGPGGRRRSEAARPLHTPPTSNNVVNAPAPVAPGLHHAFSPPASLQAHPAPGMVRTPASLSSHGGIVRPEESQHHMHNPGAGGMPSERPLLHDTTAANAAVAAAAAAGFLLGPQPHHQPLHSSSLPVPDMANAPFSPQYGVAQVHDAYPPPLRSHSHPPHQARPQQAQPPPLSTPAANVRDGPLPPPPQDQQTPYDPMFGGGIPSPAPWPTGADDNPATAAVVPGSASHHYQDTQHHHQNGSGSMKPGVGGAASPGAVSSHGGSIATVGEEKDPFLSLLEQLAESESIRGPGNELDFFLGLTPQENTG